MPTFSIIIQPEAELDLDDAHLYLEDQKAGLGFDLLAEISDILEILESNPFLFQKTYGDKRRAMIKRFDYNIIYMIREQRVFILAIIHGMRDSKRWE